MPFTLTMPKLSPTMNDGIVAKWHKKEGDYCEADDLVLDIGTDKATIEHHTIDPGFLRKILVQEGGRATVGAPLAILSESMKEDISSLSLEQASPKAPPPKKTAVATEKTTYSPSRISASPLAKRLAKERGIPLDTVTGSGPRGRIMSRDLTGPKMIAGEVPLSSIREVIAKRLSFSKATIPHFYCSIKVDASCLYTLREELKSQANSLTINDFIVRACALALMKHPSIRCSFNPERNTIVKHTHADIAVAVTTGEGLFTPIIFEAEKKPIAVISKEIKALAEKAKTGKLLPQEFLGGAFTISNLGMFGIDEFYPIINPPQVAILGVGAVVDSPMVRDKVIVAGKALSLCISADHRALDGIKVSGFLKTLKELLEQPAQLML